MTAATNPYYHMTYSEIAEVLGVSRQRVKQIEQAALAKLRRHELHRQDRKVLLQHYIDSVYSAHDFRDRDVAAFDKFYRGN